MLLGLLNTEVNGLNRWSRLVVTIVTGHGEGSTNDSFKNVLCQIMLTFRRYINFVYIFSLEMIQKDSRTNIHQVKNIVCTELVDNTQKTLRQ